MRTNLPSVAALVIWTLAYASAATASQKTCFHLFDSTAYRDKPDLSAYGIERADTYEPVRWWPRGGGGDDLPDPSAAQRWVNDMRKKRGLVVLDVERWWIGGTNATAGEDAVRRYITVLDWIRGAGYTGPLGYYGILPIGGNPARVLQAEGGSDREQWLRENARAQPLADRVEVIYPSLYTRSPDAQAWELFASRTLQQAHKMAPGKPVYAFLWPQYNPGDPTLALRYIPASLWTKELELVKKSADGAIIWGGIATSKAEGVPSWDPAADWWKATVEFISRQGTCALPSPPADLKVTPSGR
jgi:hypothetical protein